MLLAAWVAVVTAVAVVVPGALTGRALHLPWPVAVAAGPPVTFAIVGLWSVLLGWPTCRGTCRQPWPRSG